MKSHPDCCEKFKKKGKKACKDCPLMASLSKKKRQKVLKKYSR